MPVIVDVASPHVVQTFASVRAAANQHEQWLKVGKSTLANAGNGLFATQKIDKGTVVCEYKGVLLTKQELHQLYPANWLMAPYVATTPWGAIDAWDPNPTSLTFGKARYINDCTMLETLSSSLVVSCPKTNVQFVSLIDTVCKDKRGLFVIASRDIEKGEELFVEYGRQYWGRSTDHFYRNCMIQWLVKYHDSFPNGVALSEFAKVWHHCAHLIPKLRPMISELALKQHRIQLEPHASQHIFRVLSWNA